MTAFYVMNFIMLIFLGVMYIFMPVLMNKYLLFGVTINDVLLESDEVIDIKRSYRVRMTLTTLFVVVFHFVWVMMFSESAIIGFVTLLFLEIITMSIFYISAHKSVKVLKGDTVQVENRIVSAEIGGATEIKVLPTYSFLLYLIVIIGVVWYSFSIYESIPDMIAIHFDANGVVDRYAEKSVMYVLMMPITMFFMTLLFAGVNYSMKIAKKVSGVSRGKLTIEQEKKYRFMWSIGTYILGFIIILLFAVIQFFSIEVFTQTSMIMWITVMSVLAVVVLIVILAVTLGQSGSRVKTVEDNNEIVDTDDDASWKLGAFYVNKEDPSLFVNKRFGIGMTLNFGNKLSWIFIGVLLVVVLAAVILPFVLG